VAYYAVFPIGEEIGDVPVNDDLRSSRNSESHFKFEHVLTSRQHSFASLNVGTANLLASNFR